MRQHLDLKSQIYESEAVLQATLQKISQDLSITEANRENIAAFVEDGQSRGLTSTRLAIVAHHLRRLGRLTKADFNTFSTEDAKKVMKALEATKYSEWVKATCKKLFKQLMRSYNKPAEIYSWIVTGHPPNKLRKEDLLTPEELRQLIASAPDNMWKSLISLLAETGCRPGEALNLTIGSVIVNSDHIKLYVAGKMAKSAGERPLFLFKTYDVLNAWLQEHPSKGKPNAPLWITKSTGTPLSLHTLNIIFKRIVRRAGITKRCYPYLLRHCFGTYAYTKYSPALAMKMMGHSDAKTGQIYTHLAEEDVLEALQREHGLKPKKQESEDAELCQSCGHSNPYGSIQCNACKAGLGAAGAIKVQQEHDAELQEARQLKALLADPQILNILKALKDERVINALKEAVKKNS